MKTLRLFLTVVLCSGMAFGYGLLGCGDDEPTADNGDGSVCVTEGPFGHATCSDDSDNDCDGLIDANDSDCHDVIVTCPDPNLEAAIRDAITKPTGDIMASDLQGLNALYAGHEDISDITGMEYCVNLTWLVLYSNHIVDVSPLAGLVNLTDLVLSSNHIVDVGPLAGLVNLTWLDLLSNQITDLEPLVLNTGIDSGDLVYVWDNPLDATSCTVHIPALEGRGVTVNHSCP